MTKRQESAMGVVMDLAERRVQRVKELARAAAEGQSGGKAAFDLLRSNVAGEILNQDSATVTQRALDGLSGESAQTMLRMAIQDAIRVFYLDDRALAAVVVPVGLRLSSSKQDAISVKEANEMSMPALAMVVQGATGARHVAFDQRLYRGHQLLNAKPRDLREHLVNIEAGQAKEKGLTAVTPVKSGPQSDWEVVYLLGVAVFNRGDEDVLLAPEVEERMGKQGCHAEWAMDQSHPTAWALRVMAHAKCLGYYSMHRGIQVGEDRLRVLQLDSLISNMEQGVEGLLFRYAVDEEGDRIRLLIRSNVETAEFVWKRYGEEGVSAFRRGLDEVISDRVPDTRDIQEIGLNEYLAIAAKRGIVW